MKRMDGKFQAQISGKHIGCFDTAEDAATAYAVYKDYGKDRQSEAKAKVKEMVAATAQAAAVYKKKAEIEAKIEKLQKELAELEVK